MQIILFGRISLSDYINYDFYDDLQRVKSLGYEPVCIATRLPADWGREYSGLPVMSLETAAAKYPDFKIYVTAPCETEVSNDIYAIECMLRLPPERIVNHHVTERFIQFSSLVGDSWDKAMPVVFYGAGSWAPAFLYKYRNLGISPICFCDKDTSKYGAFIDGVPICSIDEIIAKYDDQFYVIITIIDKIPVANYLINEKKLKKNQLLNNYKSKYSSGSIYVFK